ncbi:multidrug ABC transporter ATP-binding protein, partial [Bifidobacteriaceae bacterium NR015]
IKKLTFVAKYCKIPKNRILEALDIAGISSIQNMKIKEMSTGMYKRLEVAAALLADPHNLILDNPFYGLDVEVIKWLRGICRYYAERGGAVLISTNNISELSLIADDLVIIAHGEILQKTSVADLLAAYSQNTVRVITPEPEKLFDIMQSQHSECSIMQVEHKSEDVQEGAAFVIDNANIADLAQFFNDKQLLTYQLSKECVSLEDAYMATIGDNAAYVSKPLYVYNNEQKYQNPTGVYVQE